LKSIDTTKLFGTDGIRGEAGKFPLDRRATKIIGTSLARHLAERTGRVPRIVIGRDTRESGSWIARALIAGARDAAAEVYSAGVITTPGVAFLARTLPADAGVVISASHNPYRDNGIKIFEPSGRKLDETTESLIEKDIAGKYSESADLNESANEDPSDRNEQNAEQLQTSYLDYLAHSVGHDLSFEGLKMVIDCANGAAYEMAPKLFRRIGADVIAINARPNGQNINFESGSLHIEGLQNKIAAERAADLGVAFDGDADRALFVDANGKLVDGDATLWVMASYLKSRGELEPRKVIATVMSNIGLEVALRSQGIELFRTDVGDKYVLDELLRSGAAVGGEQSGHIIFPKLSLAGDGMITTLCLLRAMHDQNRSLAELTRGFQRYPQVLVNVRVHEKRPFDQIPSVQSLALRIEEKLSNHGRLLLRYSGTEPLARVMIEGENENEIKASANELAQTLKAAIGTNHS